MGLKMIGGCRALWVVILLVIIISEVVNKITNQKPRMVTMKATPPSVIQTKALQSRSVFRKHNYGSVPPLFADGACIHSNAIATKISTNRLPLLPPRMLMMAVAARKSEVGSGDNNYINTEGLVLPPSSKEESISQAAKSISAYLGNGEFKTTAISPKSKGKKGKKSKSAAAMNELLELQGKKLSSGGARIAIEMSLGADDSRSVADMALSLMKVLPKPIKIVFGDHQTKTLATESADARSSSGAILTSFKDNDDDLDHTTNGGEKASLLIVGASAKQLPQVVNCIQDQASKTHVVLLNAEFTPQPPAAAKDFVQSFEVVYSILPLEIQGFLGSKKGAVFRAFKEPKSFFWRTFTREDDDKEWEATGSWKARPNAKQIEDSMYGSGAGDNPINKGISGIKNIFGR